MSLARIHKLLQYPSGSVAVAFAYGRSRANHKAMRNFKLIATSVLAILVAILVCPEQGTGSNAPAICNSRYASRHSAFHRLRGRIRAWSPSHYVAEDNE
jgi:hypothetical protein